MNNTTLPALEPIGSLFRKTWQIYTKRFLVLIGILAIPLVISTLGIVLFPQGFTSITVWYLIFFVIEWVMLMLGSIALIAAIGLNTSFKGSYRVAFKIFWPVLWLGILTFLIGFGGLVALIIPGIIAGVFLLFSTYVLILEHKHGWNAVLQSKEYVRGYFWSVFGRLILLFFVAIVAYLVLDLFLITLFGNFASEVPILVVNPFSAIFFYRIYENLRSVKPDSAVAHTAPAGGRGWLIAGMAIGIVASVLLVGFGIFSATHQAPSSAPPAPNSTGNLVVIDPQSGPIGQKVTIVAAGTKFGATTTVFMNKLVAEKNVAVGTGGTIVFTVPQDLAPNCTAGEACLNFLMLVGVGNYPVTVLAADGTQVPVGTFTVTGGAAGVATSSPGPLTM